MKLTPNSLAVRSGLMKRIPKPDGTRRPHGDLVKISLPPVPRPQRNPLIATFLWATSLRAHLFIYLFSSCFRHGFMDHLLPALQGPRPPEGNSRLLGGGPYTFRLPPLPPSCSQLCLCLSAPRFLLVGVLNPVPWCLLSGRLAPHSRFPCLASGPSAGAVPSPRVGCGNPRAHKFCYLRVSS